MSKVTVWSGKRAAQGSEHYIRQEGIVLKSSSGLDFVSCCQDQHGAAAAPSLATEKFAAALKVKQAAQAGRFGDVEAELRRLDARFTENHPKVPRGGAACCGMWL